jgi:two-component system, OmpR family, sensor histidine kinase MprB
VSFKARLTLGVAAAVAIAVAVAAAGAYFAARNELFGQIDQGLFAQAETIAQLPPDRLLGYRGALGAGYYQVVSAAGVTQRPLNERVPLPVAATDKQVATGGRGAFYRDDEAGHQAIRMYTFQYADGYAVQVVSLVGEINQALSRLLWILVGVAAGGIAVAVLLAFLVTRAVLRPVRRLTEASEHVAETRDLSGRMDASGRDELARLAASFNTMLEALEDSLRAQRQLVADASHELRTPLTSLRTNIEVLARADALPAAERETLLADVVEQLTEMSTLVSELVQLARGDEPAGEPEIVRLDELVAESVERARRNSPRVTFATELYESTVEAVPAALERAVGNLLDNAAKWSPPGGTVEVAVVDHEVAVRDHGPGIDESDLPFVFDRFYRAPSARGMPGSGLGLAIVHQVAKTHGGDVIVERPRDGGTLMRLRLPVGPAA